jgi:hypothetical protein
METKASCAVFAAMDVRERSREWMAGTDWRDELRKRIKRPGNDWTNVGLTENLWI